MEICKSSYYSVMLWATGVKLQHVIAHPKVAEGCKSKNLPISNAFKGIAHWVSQSSYYLVILQPTGVKLHHMITCPKVAE